MIHNNSRGRLRQYHSIATTVGRIGNNMPISDIDTSISPHHSPCGRVRAYYSISVKYFYARTRDDNNNASAMHAPTTYHLSKRVFHFLFFISTFIKTNT